MMRASSLPAAREKGVSLVELMVAVTIACAIVGGVLGLHAQVRGTFRVNERVARLQEQGRVALSVIEPDIELAGYYGFTNAPGALRLVSGAAPSVVMALAGELRQFPAAAGGPLPAAVGGLPPGAHTCGVNFAVDVMMPVQGANDAFALGRGSKCAGYRGRAAVGSDTLTLRRAETQSSAAEPGRIQVYASRSASRTSQLMFADGIAPGVQDASHRVHNLVVRAYYVARDSVGQDDVPALRVKTLTRSGTGVAFDDDEIMSGIEDLQVQFGIDAGGDTLAGHAARYVDPDFAELPRVHVVAVRVWVRVRADEPEVGFQDAKTYRYANVVYTPAGPARGYRRVLMSRTVTLRNARTR